MSEQTSLFKEKFSDVKSELFYVTYDNLVKDRKNTRIAKGYSPGKESPKEALRIAMEGELGDHQYPRVVQTGVGVIEWLKKDTNPDPIMRSNITIEINPSVGNEVTLENEGTFIVKGKGDYESSLCTYPFLILTSMENNYDVIMSLRALNHKLLRKNSPHKYLNYMLMDDVVIENRPEYWFTVGYLVNKAEIHLRTTPSTDQKVRSKYRNVVGSDITSELYDKFVYYNDNEDTFTDNADLRLPIDDPNRLRLFFPKNKIGKREGQVTKDHEIFHSTEFVWTLFNYGFRLGTKHNIKKVYSYVNTHQKEYLKYFEEGLGL